MEAFKIIKRIAIYLVFIIAAAFFFYYSVSLALAPYLKSFPNQSTLLLEGIYLPLMYAVISLVTMFFAQFLLIGKPHEIETNIYAWLLTIYFGVGLAAGVIILAYGLVSMQINNDARDPTYLICAMIPCLVVMLVEVIYGLFCSFKNKKMDTLKEKEEKAKEEKENAGDVNLHKE